jgi:hypothetical protein
VTVRTLCSPRTPAGPQELSFYHPFGTLRHPFAKTQLLSPFRNLRPPVAKTQLLAAFRMLWPRSPKNSAFISSWSAPASPSQRLIFSGHSSVALPKLSLYQLFGTRLPGSPRNSAFPLFSNPPPRPARTQLLSAFQTGPVPRKLYPSLLFSTLFYFIQVPSSRSLTCSESIARTENRS